jgi:hypothetical protein
VNDTDRLEMLRRFAVDTVNALVPDPTCGLRSHHVETMTKLLVMVYECGRADANAETVAALEQVQSTIRHAQDFLSREDKDKRWPDEVPPKKCPPFGGTL